MMIIRKLEFDYRVFLVSLYVDLVVILHFNPLSFNEINKIDVSSLGLAMFHNIDINKRIRNFYIFFSIFIILLIAFYILFLKIKKIDKSYVMEFIYNISIVGFINLFNPLFSILKNQKFDLYVEHSNYFLVILIILVIISMKFTKNNRITFNNIKLIINSSIILTIFMILFFNIDNNYFIYIYCFIYFVILIFLYLLLKTFNIELNEHISLFIPINLIVINLLISTEIAVILNQHFIFTVGKYKILFIICFIELLFILINNHLNYGKFNFRNNRIFYLITIISVFMVIYQPEVINYVDTDLFEQANHGLTAYELLTFNKLPFLETLDAHMLSNSIWSIIYGFLNNDNYGSMFLIYGGYGQLLLVIIFFNFLLIFLDIDFAFFLVLFIPSFLFDFYLNFGLLSLIFIHRFLVKKTNTNLTLVVLSLFILILYRLDIAQAFLIPVILVLSVFLFLYDKKFIRIFYLQIISFAIFLLVVWIFVSYSRNIDPFERINEFLHIFNSNTNWAYNSLGNLDLVSASFLYILLPIIIISFNFILILKRIIDPKIINIEKFLILEIIFLSYFINFSRSIVRHNLVEMNYIIIIFSALIYLLIIIILFNNDVIRRNLYISIYMIISIFIYNMFNDNMVFSTTNSFENMSTRLENSNFNINLGNEKIQRVIPTFDFQNKYLDVSLVLNHILTENETYLDFTNQSLLFSLSNLDNPVYVNQSPGLLNDTITQDYFINEIVNSRKDVVLALLPISNLNLAIEIDSINNSFRYYKISEFITRNFTPYFSINNQYAIWIRKGYENSIIDKINLLYKKTSYSYGLFQDISYNDVTIINDIDETIIYSGNTDPYIYNLFNNLNNFGFQNGDINIRIEYKSERSGQIQFFYTTNCNESFSETKSIFLDIESGENIIEVNLPYSEYSKYRMDLINENTFIIKDINIAEFDLDKIDYLYGDISLHRYNLELFPNIFAKNNRNIYSEDNKIININKINENQYIVSNKNINEEYVYYLYFNIFSEVDNNLEVILTDKSNLFNVNYSLTLKQGMNDYLIRLSSDFLFYRGNLEYLELQSSNNYNLNEIYIIKLIE